MRRCRSGVCINYENSTRTHAEKGQAERSGQTERSGEGGLGVSSEYTEKHAHAQKKAKRFGQAERSGDGVLGGSS
jgi:hypothetical protein